MAKENLQNEVKKAIDTGLERAETWALIEASDIDVSINEFRKVFQELQAEKNLAIRSGKPKLKISSKKKVAKR